MQRVSTRFFLFTFLLCFPLALLGEGFRAGTLVATPAGLCPIETLLPGDRVISRTKTGEETQALITAVSKKLTMDVRKLVVAGESALVDKNQRFYVANKHAWCTVDTLAPGDELVSPDGHQVCVEDIHECERELTTLYRLTVAHHHNFCIGQSKLVAHNVTGAEYTTVKTATDVTIAIVSGTGAVVSLPIACAVGGTAAVGYGIYSLVEYMQKKNKPQSPQPDQSINNRRNAQESQEHVHIRGFGDFPDDSNKKDPEPLKDPNKDEDPKKCPNKEAAEQAKKLGFKKTNYHSHGRPVFQKGNRFITRDVDCHNGGFWKMADSVKNLARKQTRLGTYDQFLNRVGD